MENYQRTNDPMYLQTQNRKVRELWRKELGTTCRICGEPDAEYHHLIPIRAGGTNDIGNIVPLCHKHHNMVHEKIPRNIDHSKLGRKRIEPKDDVDKVMKEYLDGKHKMVIAMEMLGFKRNKFNMELNAYRARTGDNRKHPRVHDGISCGMDAYR